MEIIFEFDKDLLIFLNSTGTHRFDQFWLIVTNKYTHIPLYFFLLYLSFKKLKNRQNLNKKKLIHAYGPMKKTVIMNIDQTIKLISKTANLNVIGIKRL